MMILKIKITAISPRVQLVELLTAESVLFLFKPMLTYRQLDPEEQTSVEFESKCKTFLQRNRILKRTVPSSGHIW